MTAVRIIPCLDVKWWQSSQGGQLPESEGCLRPVEAAEAYCCEGGHELVFLDIAATVESRGTRLKWVKRVAEKVTIPFAVGGGVRNTGDMKTLFDLGVDKVSVNTAAVRNPEPVKEASRGFGKEKLVVAIGGRTSPPWDWSSTIIGGSQKW